MGKHLNRARSHFGTDTRGLLEGGRYALLHSRSLEFDDLRPYVRGDDVRDIDWKASARSGSVLIKRFVDEKHHKILLVADAGRNMTAQAPSGEAKIDVAANILGAVRADHSQAGRPDRHGVRRRPRLREHPPRAAARPTSRACCTGSTATRWRSPVQATSPANWIMWQRITATRCSSSWSPTSPSRTAVSRRRSVASRDATTSCGRWSPTSPRSARPTPTGTDTTSRPGRFVIGGANLGPRVVAAYRRAEQRRRGELEEFMTAHSIPHTTVGGSGQIRSRLVGMTEVFARAG